MAPRPIIVVFAAIAIAITVILALFVFPGYLSGGPACPMQTTAGGTAYCAEYVTLVQCQPGGYCPPHLPVAFHGADFQLTLTQIGGVPAVDGRVSQGNSTSYYVSLLGDPSGPPSVNWTSPDKSVLVEWSSPFEAVGSDGLLTANVTCGVSFTMMNGP